jgi:CRP-like cAMP-binding protein
MSLSEVAYQNLLLRALPREDLEHLCPQLEFVVLKHRQVLQHARLPIKNFYFVEQGLVSVVAKTGVGKAVEVWSVGRDGVVGLARLVGQKIPLNKYVVEIDGAAFRIGIEALERSLLDLGSLRRLLFRHLLSVLLQTAQLSGCNLCHPLPQRLARWLLTAMDRSGCNQFAITQDVLARLLGVRRATISECLHEFKEAGILDNAWGSIRILDAERLEALSCECYHIVRMISLEYWQDKVSVRV